MDDHRITPQEFAENFETYHAAAARGEAISIVADTGNGGTLVYRPQADPPPRKTVEEKRAALRQIAEWAKRQDFGGATALDHGDILYDEYGLPK